MNRKLIAKAVSGIIAASMMATAFGTVSFAEETEAAEYKIGFVVHTTSGDVMSSIQYGAEAAAEQSSMMYMLRVRTGGASTCAQPHTKRITLLVFMK